ncbi:MAG: OadG-related small transporter subunit [Pseudomonadota bacterium]
MSKIDFGLTMTLVGMGGTLLSLWALTLVMKALKRLFPEKGAAGPEAGKAGS